MGVKDIFKNHVPENFFEHVNPLSQDEWGFATSCVDGKIEVREIKHSEIIRGCPDSFQAD